MARSLKLLLAISLVFSIAVVTHTLLSPEGWQRRQRVRRDLAVVEAQVAEGERRTQELRAQIEALRTRPAMQEHVVRDELGYVRKSDVVLELSQPKGAAESN